MSARSLLIAAASLAAAAAAGCGSVTGPAASQSPGRSGAARTPGVSLEVTVTDYPGAVPTHWTLTCDPPGGTNPDPAAACRVLLAVKDPFAPLPKHVLCPMISVNPKKAVVTGTWFGEPVDITLTDSGCSAGRWAQYGKIFG